MSGNSQQLLRTTFEQVPELYDRARPSYPLEVFDDLAALARLAQAARIVEIGCGTGQATLPLAERGYQITCVELGEQLAAVVSQVYAELQERRHHENDQTLRPQSDQRSCSMAPFQNRFGSTAPPSLRTLRSQGDPALASRMAKADRAETEA